MWLDLVVIGFVGLYAWRGARRGLLVEALELAGIVIAILFARLLAPVGAALLRLVLPGSDTWATAAGGAVMFGILAAGVLVAVSLTTRRLRLQGSTGALNGVGGGVFGALWSALLVTALLLLSISVPGARAGVGGVVCESTVSRFVVSDTNPLHGGGASLARLARPVLLWVNRLLDDTFTLNHATGLCDGAAPDLGTHATYEFPPAQPDEITVAARAERAIMALLNEARAEADLPPLRLDRGLRAVGRAHARDMYLRGYFAHGTPECERGAEAEGCTDPFERMDARGIEYATAGENLALAPSPQRAHSGLMDSPGHRANILEPSFTRIGIGVFEGPFGIMVAQEFAG